MKPRILTCFSAVTLVAALTIPVGVAAQDRLGNKDERPRYILIDLGTLGGPASYIQELQPQLSNGGLIAGSADTSIPDPNPSSCLNKDCFVSHAFQWRKDVLTDLGALAGGGSSVANAINSRGWVAGFSQNGLIDPLTGQPSKLPSSGTMVGSSISERWGEMRATRSR